MTPDHIATLKAIAQACPGGVNLSQKEALWFISEVERLSTLQEMAVMSLEKTEARQALMVPLSEVLPLVEMLEGYVREHEFPEDMQALATWHQNHPQTPTP